MKKLILGIFLVCKYFTFTDGIFDRLEEGYTYTVEFYGNGYNNLYLEDAEFVD